MVSWLRGLAEETVVVIKRGGAKLPFVLKGIVRLVDPEGRTLGVVLDREFLEDLEEDLEASDPGFIASLEASRRSGIVSSKEIKKRLGMK